MRLRSAASCASTLLFRGAELDRLLDEGHAALLGAVARRLEALGWEVRPEVSFAVFGERGSIDLVAWHATSGTLLVDRGQDASSCSVEETLRRPMSRCGSAERWRGGSAGGDAVHACSCCRTAHGGARCSRAAFSGGSAASTCAWRSPGWSSSRRPRTVEGPRWRQVRRRIGAGPAGSTASRRRAPGSRRRAAARRRVRRGSRAGSPRPAGLPGSGRARVPVAYDGRSCEPVARRPPTDPAPRTGPVGPRNRVVRRRARRTFVHGGSTRSSGLHERRFVAARRRRAVRRPSHDRGSYLGPAGRAGRGARGSIVGGGRCGAAGGWPARCAGRVARPRVRRRGGAGRRGAARHRPRPREARRGGMRDTRPNDSSRPPRTAPSEEQTQWPR